MRFINERWEREVGGVFAFQNTRTDAIELVQIEAGSAIAPWKVLVQHRGAGEKWRQLLHVPIKIETGGLE